MNLTRIILELYRSVLFRLFNRKMVGVMSPGVGCHIEPFRYDENHGDVVHPCVRYIKDGFEGNHWWMVYTPYYAADAAMENPILCYSESKEHVPPTDWKVYCLVNEKPEDGYNSDPTLLYHNGQLYVYWRENIVKNKDKYSYSRATFCALVGNKTVQKLDEPVLVAKVEHEDPECCPTFMVSDNGELLAYAMHLQFFNPKIRAMRSIFKSFIERGIFVLDLLGIYSQQKSYGVAIWQGGRDASKPFKYAESIQFSNKNHLWRPWHMDFFDYDGKRYAVVQSNMCNADIVLAWSDDNRHFSFYPKPLITNKSIDKLGIYKPCAFVLNGNFYLFYTAQDKDNRALNKLYMTQMDFNELKTRIK